MYMYVRMYVRVLYSTVILQRSSLQNQAFHFIIRAFAAGSCRLFESATPIMYYWFA